MPLHASKWYYCRSSAEVVVIGDLEKLTNKLLLDIVVVLGKRQRNDLLASRVYAERYSDRRRPKRKAFQALTTTGAVEFKNYFGRKPIYSVRIQKNPESSICQINNATTAKSFIHKILKNKSRYYSFRTQIHQELFLDDFQKRVIFC